MEGSLGTGLYGVDIAVIAITLISGLLALARGLVREVFSIVAWIGAIVLSLYLYPYVSPLFAGFIDNTKIADFVSGIIVFLIALLVLSLLAIAISSLVKGKKLNIIDRTLGLIFGLVRGLAIVSFLYLMVSIILFQEDQPTWIKDANTRPVLAYGAQTIYMLVPGRVWKDFGFYAENVEDLIPTTPIAPQ